MTKVELPDTPKAALDKPLLDSAAPPKRATAKPERVWKRDERGFIIGEGAERFGVTPIAFTEDSSNDLGRRFSKRIPYLEGLRGFLGVQTLLWIFFRLFAPAIVTDTDMDGTRPAAFALNAPTWQTVLRKVLSPLLFDGSLQMTGFLILCGRVALQTYTERRSGINIAGPCFRRPFRLALPIAVALAIPSALAATNGFRYSSWLADRLQNDMLRPPQVFDSVLVYFNSVVTFFFAPVSFKDARAVLSLPPYGVTWFLAVVFQQIYVMTIAAFVIPYTVMRYKIIAGFGYIILSAWVGSWSWYTLTGLAICEFSVVHRQVLPADKSWMVPLPLGGRKVRVSYKVVPLAFILVGTFFRYLWIAALPGAINNEIIFHADLNTARLNTNVNPAQQAVPRWDTWIFMTGLFVLIELSPRLQRILSAKPLVWLGRLSFSIILTSATVMMALGGLIYQHLVETAGITNITGLTAIMFVILIPLTLLTSAIFAVAVDTSNLYLSHLIFKFMIAP